MNQIGLAQSQGYRINIRYVYTIERGILLEDLKELLEPDILHLVNLLLTDVQIQVKYKNKIGENFKPNIGSPQGDCASPIWFIFYLHKALQTIKSPQTRDKKDKNKHNYELQRTAYFINQLAALNGGT